MPPLFIKKAMKTQMKMSDKEISGWLVQKSLSLSDPALSPHAVFNSLPYYCGVE
jgi:hypothetical protein